MSCPITLQKPPPERLVTIDSHPFDANAFAEYLMTSGNLVNPLTRRPLCENDLRAIFLCSNLSCTFHDFNMSLADAVESRMDSIDDESIETSSVGNLDMSESEQRFYESIDVDSIVETFNSIMERANEGKASCIISCLGLILLIRMEQRRESTRERWEAIKDEVLTACDRFDHEPSNPPSLSFLIAHLVKHVLCHDHTVEVCDLPLETQEEVVEEDVEDDAKAEFTIEDRLLGNKCASDILHKEKIMQRVRDGHHVDVDPAAPPFSLWLESNWAQFIATSLLFRHDCRIQWIQTAISEKLCDVATLVSIVRQTCASLSEFNTFCQQNDLFQDADHAELVDAQQYYATHH